MLITPIDKYFYFIAVCILDVEDVEASQSTMILEEEDDEDRAAIVNMDSIHRVVSMSQHFSATPLSQQSGQNPLPTHSNQFGTSPSPHNNQVGISPLPIHDNQERICHPFPSQQSDENSNFPPNSKSGKFSQLSGRTLTPSLSKQQLNSSALFSPCVILRKLSGAPHSF